MKKVSVVKGVVEKENILVVNPLRLVK